MKEGALRERMIENRALDGEADHAGVLYFIEPLAQPFMICDAIGDVRKEKMRIKSHSPVHDGRSRVRERRLKHVSLYSVSVPTST